ncbi:MAG TPA: thioesterase family protein [Acidobacteriaceae bacterium]|jgi:acyl-CoA thioester hydrolase|nr:thioesterase family protein [Acidobacteriaceae bacterium]
MSIVSELRVRYAETDQMGVVYHANYLVWFEVGRVEFMRALGFDYKQMEVEDGCILPVIEATCRYKAPARYDDMILIDAGPILLRGSLLKFAYRIIRASNTREGQTLLAEGETVHIVCDASMQKCLMPERYAAPIRAAIRVTDRDEQGEVEGQD